MRPTTRAVRLLLGGLLTASLAAPLSGCRWSVPADPGLNLRERGTAPATIASAEPTALAGATAVPDDGARALYQRRCGQCHAPLSPRHAAPAQWPSLVRHYGPRAGLFGEERARVVRYLQLAAR